MQKLVESGRTTEFFLVTDAPRERRYNPRRMTVEAPIDPQAVAHTLEDFLAGARDAVVIEDDIAVFDLRSMRYSVTDSHGKCLLHLWSPERNIVRRVLDVEQHGEVLRISAQRFGQSKPSHIEFVLERDRRTPTARKSGRAQYQRRLQAALEREFPGWRLDRMSSAMDLERSFGPVHARGLLRRGSSAFALLGTNSAESQAAVDDSVAAGLLWLQVCREQFAARGHVEGLKLFCPPRRWAMAASRLAALDAEAAKWQLYALDERDGQITSIDLADSGNVETRLVRCPDDDRARERFAESIARVRGIVPDAEISVLSAGEIGFRCHGLEFARARMAPHEPEFRLSEEVCFGLGAAETVLDGDSAPRFASFARRLFATRRAGGDRNHPLFRTAPERWLESLVCRDVQVIDHDLDPGCVYSQVPAFSASDRAVIDVLAITRGGRLAVIELKAEEDLHLPVQGLDYWSRVRWHQARGEFQRYGYFAGRELSTEPPLLYLVAPALHLHPTTDTLLRYVAPEVDVCVIGVDERWRDGVRVVFKKHRPARPLCRG